MLYLKARISEASKKSNLVDISYIHYSRKSILSLSNSKIYFYSVVLTLRII